MGTILEIGQGIDSKAECNAFCLTVPTCSFWTYYEDLSYCGTYKTCVEHNTECTHCYYGESGCYDDGRY